MTKSGNLITADIGGTNARFAIVNDIESESLEIAAHTIYQCKDYNGVSDMLCAFMHENSVTHIQDAHLAIAGKTSHHEGSVTNLGWYMTSDSLQNSTGLKNVTFMNDFEAIAHAVPSLDKTDFLSVKTGDSVPNASMSVMGPGTGFGVAQLIPLSGQNYKVMPTEAGHASFAPVNNLEQKLWTYLGEQQDHICIEALLSGRGLVCIHDFLIEQTEKGTTGLSPADITCRALDQVPLCVRAVEVFLSILGSVAGDIALSHGASGGVWLAGGILPKILEMIPNSDLVTHFEAKGIMSSYLKNVPINVIVNTNVALIGAAVAAREN